MGGVFFQHLGIILNVLKAENALERVEFVEALLFLVFAGRLVARVKLGRGRLLLFAVCGSSARIGAGLHLRSVMHVVGLWRSVGRLLYRRQRLVVASAG